MATWLPPALSVMAMVEDWTASLKVAETVVVTGTPVAPARRLAIGDRRLGGVGATRVEDHIDPVVG